MQSSIHEHLLSLRILNIDDDDIDRMNLTRQLKAANSNIEVVATANVEDALQYLENERFDMIFVDYFMPKVTGFEFINYLNTSTEINIPIVVLSNMEDMTISLECLIAGAQDFILKSEINSSRLIRVILQSRKRNEIKQALVESNQQLKELAEIDQLTGLENRYMFDRNLKKMFQQHSVVSGGFALLLLDLDHFKTINDTLGHSVGDELLTAAALRIKNNIRQECKVYRLGGDEFGIISTLQNKHEIEQLVPRLMNTLNTPYALTDMNIECTSSIGIAIYPDDATSAESLYKHADMALYIAKDEGRDRCQFYNEDIQHRFLRKIYIEDAVKKSLKNKYFSVFYQPVISQLQSKLVGAEALLRWGPEQHFQISIPETIKVAEDTGLIIQIGYQVFELVCRQLSLWRSTNTVDDDFAISVNLSPAQLKCVDILERFNRIATKYDVLPKHIKLEITESLQLDDEKTNSILTDLSNAGYKIVLDDFGTGYASIAQLCNPIFSTIKIDKSIIDTIATDDEKLFYAVSKMLNTLNLPIIAEGIETQSQLDACFGVNIDMIQGYFYSKPTTAEVFEQRWLTH